MSATYERVLRVIAKPPGFRQDFEILSIMPWLRKQSQLFLQLKQDYLKDIIRNCGLETYERENIIIRQGDPGDCFYIILGGKISIYILNKEKDEDGDEKIPLEQIGTKKPDGQLDRSKLGNFVTHLGAGVPFGDVALLSDDCVRTATIIAEEKTDLFVVDKALYNRAVKEVLAREYEDKVNFITTYPLFSNWAPRYRKQLTMAMYKETFPYNSTLVRQGEQVENIYFLISGHVELQTEPALHPTQYPKIYLDTMDEGERLIKKDKIRPPTETQYATNIRRKKSHKHTKMFLLGKNESVGELEVLLDMSTYMQTAVCTEQVEVLVLEMKHYERLFVKRHPRTIDAMREMLELKLETRMSLLPNIQDVPFLINVKKKLNLINNPKPLSTKKDKNLPSGKRAERDFLNHKGPLVDIYGPGSVFYMIRVREKAKQRVGHKTDRLDNNARNKNKSSEHLHSVRLPQSLVMAAQMAGALKDKEIFKDTRDGGNKRRPASARLGSARIARSYRRIQSAMKAENEDDEIDDTIADVYDDAETSRSWPEAKLGTTTVSFIDNEDDENLSKLENKVRDWLNQGNPKSGPHVTQLRRLNIEDLETIPKPGNKVVVRKRNPSQPSSSSGSEKENSNVKENSIQSDKLSHYKILLAQ